jgi:electron transport complex protein RnfD
MTTWPTPAGFSTGYIDAVTGATPLSIIKEGIKNGESISALMEKIPSTVELFLGKMGGSIGEISAIALLIGFAYMLYKRIITWHIPVSVIGSLALFTFILRLSNPDVYA